jgi:hypothetical protein
MLSWFFSFSKFYSHKPRKLFEGEPPKTYIYRFCLLSGGVISACYVELDDFFPKLILVGWFGENWLA